VNNTDQSEDLKSLLGITIPSGKNDIEQGYSTHNPRDTDGPRSSLPWPAGHFEKITTNAIKQKVISIMPAGHWAILRYFEL